MYDLSTDKCLDRLLTALGLTPEDLTLDELRSMMWLTGWDWQCIDTLERVFKKSTLKREAQGVSPGPLVCLSIFH